MFKLAKSMNENQSVFSPIKVGNTIYKNRIILAPQKPRNCAISRTFIHEETVELQKPKINLSSNGLTRNLKI